MSVCMLCHPRPVTDLFFGFRVSLPIWTMWPPVVPPHLRLLLNLLLPLLLHNHDHRLLLLHNHNHHLLLLHNPNRRLSPLLLHNLTRHLLPLPLHNLTQHSLPLPLHLNRHLLPLLLHPNRHSLPLLLHLNRHLLLPLNRLPVRRFSAPLVAPRLAPLKRKTMRRPPLQLHLNSPLGLIPALTHRPRLRPLL